MCDPVSLATANQMQSALFIGNETNKATNEYNRNLANNFNASMVQMQEQRGQMGEQAQQQMSEIGRKAQQERARLAALAFDNGAQGASAQRLQSTAAMDTEAALQMTERNLDSAMVQSQRQAEGLRRQTIGNFRQGTSWDGLNLQLQGIEMAGLAQNADRIAAEQARKFAIQAKEEAARKLKPYGYLPGESLRS